MTAIVFNDSMACSTRDSASVYHAARGVSSSAVNLFLRSPRLFEARYVLGQVLDEDRDTRALDIGTAGHGWVLEPDRFPDCVALVPDDILDKAGHMTTKAAKEWKSAQNGKVILKEREWMVVKNMRRALHLHPVAHALIENSGDRELSVYWRCLSTNLERKSRVDLLTSWNGRTLIADIKTTSDHSPEAFGRAMHKWGYNRQAAFYQDAVEAIGFGRPPFVFVVVCSKPPHVVRVYEPDARAMSLARSQLEYALDEIAARYATCDWRENCEELIASIGLPRWAFTEEV